MLLLDKNETLPAAYGYAGKVSYTTSRKTGQQGEKNNGYIVADPVVEHFSRIAAQTHHKDKSTLITFLFKRIIRKPGLTILILLAITLAVGAINSIPIFTGAVDRAILQEELTAYGRTRDQPPLGIRMYTYGTPSQPISMTLVEDAMETVRATLTAQTGLPAISANLHAHSINFSAETPEAIDPHAPTEKPDYINFVTYPALAGRIKTVDGTPYADAATASGTPVPVWIRQDLADRLNVAVGDTFDCQAAQRIDQEDIDEIKDLNVDPITVRVAGTWQPLNLETVASNERDLWFDDPDKALMESLLISRSDYRTHIEPRQRVRTHRAMWDVVLDVRLADPNHASRYLAGLRRTLTLMQANIPGILYDQAPYPPLEAYVARDRVLTAQLLSFSIPGLGFMACFLAISAAIVAKGLRRDMIAMLSRGTTIVQLLGLTALEVVVLHIVALPLGLVLARLLAQGMGNARGFLTFQTGAAYPIMLQDASLPLSLLALATTMTFQLLATYRQTQVSLAEEDQAHARPPHPPFWMRYGLDLLLILPTLYLARLLRAQGSLAALAPLRGEQLYARPELILVPALALTAAAMLSVRLLPPLATGMSWVAGLLAPPSDVLAMRHLARRWQAYTAPLVLVILSLALGVYTLSMAESIDQWLLDRTYYYVGADLSFSPFLDIPATTPFGSPSGAMPVGGAWIPPVDDFRRLPGIADAARASTFPATLRTGQATITGQVLAVDRVSLSSVGWFRDDLSPASLGGLMNQLAASQNAVLVQQTFLRDNLLRIGDDLSANIALDHGLILESTFTIAGTYDLFPTIYPESGPTLIANLDYLSYLGGIVATHDIWAKTDGTEDGLAIFQAVEQTGIEAGARRDVAALVANARSRHEHVGLFGTLSLGFAITLLMASVALITYRQTALQDRLHRLAILHALGVPRSQLLRSLLLEEIVLFLFSTGTALGLGLMAAQVFVPLLRITEGAQSLLPPMIPVIALDKAPWLIAGFLLITAVVDVGLTLRALSHSRFAALKVFV